MKLNDCALFKCQKNGKAPATQHGYLDAETNFDIEEYSKRGYNIGLACCKSNIIVLDCDVDEARGLNGLKSLEELENELGKLPETLTQHTPRGGVHFLFTDKGIIKPTGKIGKDIDVKYNGHILIEPSKIDDKSYKFTNGINQNGDFILADLPKTWVDYLNQSIKIVQILNHTHIKPLAKKQRKIIDGDFKRMYDECAFIKHCVNNAKTLSEPLWHLFACVLNSFSNGEELFDYYSQDYPDYNPLATKKKFKNASKYNVNCETISNYFADCAKCNHRKDNNNER